MGLVTLAMLGLPLLLEILGHYPLIVQEWAYLSLSAGFGLLTGAGFPLGVRQAHRDLGEVAASGGLSEAADSLGGALGGLITGALLVPLLGVEGSGRLLALLSLSTLLPVLYGRYVPARIAALRLRGEHAFPWPLLGWGLLFLILTLYGWELSKRRAAPEPQLQFEQALLAEVSGSKHFRLEPAPFPHYLGWAQEAAEETSTATATLSTMGPAADVNGFAGPLNLLLSLDRDGRLQGVRYIDSNETPSYISGIQAGLAGQELGEIALSLGRFASFGENAQHWLLMGFVPITALFHIQIWMIG